MLAAGPMSVAEHKAFSPPPTGVRVALVTASDSRTAADDEGGRVLRGLAEEAGFTIADAKILREEPAGLRAHVAAHMASFKVPEFVEFCDDPLPRNPAGKILKNLLRGATTSPFVQP